MESKVEDKVRYYFFNNSSRDGYYDFSIPVNEFEELLKIAIKNLKNPFRNIFKLYGINNKFFKIFHDGSCFGYNLKKSEINQINSFYQHKTTQNQIYNDDFAGLKLYWIEELYEEITFKLDDSMNMVFSKMIDIPRNYVEYSIFLEPKNISVDIKNYRGLVDGIISEKNESNIF